MVRTTHARVGIATALLGLAASCAGGTADDEPFTEEDRALLRGMALDPARTPPVDVGNELSVGTPAQRQLAARFGQQLFFDRDLSARAPDGSGVACADCHAPDKFFSDARPENHVSFGVDWTGRNSPSVVNVGYYVTYAWDGRSDSLWAQVKFAYEAGATMKGNPLLLLKQVKRKYGDRFTTVFGFALPAELASDAPNRFNATPLDPMTQQEVDHDYKLLLKAWGAYLLQLNAGASPFDAFALGDDDALTPSQKRGLRLFIGKAGCITCHLGPSFTDNQFHNLGLPQDGSHVPAEDLGRYKGLLAFNDASFDGYRLTRPLAPSDADRGRFRTKSLRNVAETAPYFHAGQAQTLKDVVWLYARGGLHEGVGTPSPLLVPLELSDAEQEDLVAFLESLTGTPVSQDLRCNPARSMERVPDTTPCAVVP